MTLHSIAIVVLLTVSCVYSRAFACMKTDFLITLMFHGGIMQLHVNHRRLGNDLV